MWREAIVVIVIVSAGCATPRGRRVRIPPTCADGLPPKILTDVACPPDSICGYSCLPQRWAIASPDDSGEL